MRALCRFDGIGSLYCKGVLEEEVDVLDRKHDGYVTCPLVTTFFFVGGRQLKVRRNRGPYLNDHDYILAFTQVELEDMKLLRDSAPTADGTTSGDATDYDEDLAEDAPDIERTIHKLQDLLPLIFCRPLTSSGTSPDPSKGESVLCYHDLSLSNVIVDPATCGVTGIVD